MIRYPFYITGIYMLFWGTLFAWGLPIKGDSPFATLKGAEQYPLSQDQIIVKPEKELLFHRLRSTKKKVDPLHLFCRKDENSCDRLIQKVTKSSSTKGLKKLIPLEKVPRREGVYSFQLSKSLEPFILMDELQKILSSQHLVLELDSETLLKDPRKTKAFLKELKRFLSKKQMETVKKKLKTGKPLLVDKDLLPKSIKKKIRKYTSFLGPNCFEAALSFQHPFFSKSYRYNVKSEEGHHKIMINNDELYTVLDRNFLELDPMKTKLRYGDLLVFIDGSEAKSERDMKFSWIKHAFVFLFNDFAFSKGSKSSNSPYTIKTLTKEWETWRRQFKHLKLKVFRKPVRDNTSFNSKKLMDWIY